MFILRKQIIIGISCLFLLFLGINVVGASELKTVNIINSPKPILLASKLKGLDTTANHAGFSKKDLPSIIGNSLKIILSLIGVLFLLLMIYGGFIWMTAGGNEKTAGKAKNIITAAVIGLIIVAAAYAITTFVADKIMS